MTLPPNPDVELTVQLEAAVIVETERLRQTITDGFVQVLRSRVTYGRMIEMVTRDIICSPDAFVRAAAWRALMDEYE